MHPNERSLAIAVHTFNRCTCRLCNIVVFVQFLNQVTYTTVKFGSMRIGMKVCTMFYIG